MKLLLTMTDIITSQNTDVYFWITLYKVRWRVRLFSDLTLFLLSKVSQGRNYFIITGLAVFLLTVTYKSAFPLPMPFDINNVNGRHRSTNHPLSIPQCVHHEGWNKIRRQAVHSVISNLKYSRMSYKVSRKMFSFWDTRQRQMGQDIAVLFDTTIERVVAFLHNQWLSHILSWDRNPLSAVYNLMILYFSHNRQRLDMATETNKCTPVY
jgi:hypothetical protein